MLGPLDNVEALGIFTPLAVALYHRKRSEIAGFLHCYAQFVIMLLCREYIMQTAIIGPFFPQPRKFEILTYCYYLMA
jgi:hypothetical protein